MLQLLRKNTERAGPVPTGPLEAQGRLCTKSVAAKVKNSVKGERVSTTPYRYWQSWQTAHTTITAMLVYKSLSMKLCHAFTAVSQKLRANQVIFIHQGESSGIHIHTGLECSLTQHFDNVVVELLVHVVHSDVKGTVQKGGHCVHNFLSQDHC